MATGIQSVAAAMQKRAAPAPFVWGANGEQLSPEEVKSRRDRAENMRHPAGYTPKGWFSLLGALAGEGVGKYKSDEADRAEKSGHAKVAEALAAARQSGDYMSVLGDEWATPQQASVAQALQSRAWSQEDQAKAWAREDARAAVARSLAAAEAAKPKWKTLEVGGDILRYNENDPDSRPEMFFDGPDAQAGFRSLTPEEKAAAGLPPDTPAQVGPDGKIDVISGGGVNVDVNNMGNIPAGYKLDYDAAGNPVSMSPVPGSPAEIEAKAALEKARLAAENKAKGANIVVEDVGRAVDLINKDPGFTTGFMGNALKSVGGLNANNVSSLIDTIKANSAFDQLQAMRAASPTGGALGAVSDTENKLLQSAIGSLEQSQSAEQLVYNLKRVQSIYGDIVNGPGAGSPDAGWTDMGGGIRIREK